MTKQARVIWCIIGRPKQSGLYELREQGKVRRENCVLTHMSDTSTNGVRRVGSSLNHYGDLEKSPIHFRPLLDSATFLQSYGAREAF